MPTVFAARLTIGSIGLLPNLALPPTKLSPVRSDNDSLRGAKHASQLNCRVFRHLPGKEKEDVVVPLAKVPQLFPHAAEQKPEDHQTYATSDTLAQPSTQALIVKKLALSAVCEATNGPCSNHASHAVILQKTATQTLIITCTGHGRYNSHYTCSQGLTESTGFDGSFGSAFNGQFPQGLTVSTGINQTPSSAINDQIPGRHSQGRPTPSTAVEARGEEDSGDVKILCLLYANHGYCHICRQKPTRRKGKPSAFDDHSRVMQHLFRAGIYCISCKKQLGFKGEMDEHERDCPGWETTNGAINKWPQKVCPNKARLRQICFPTSHGDLERQPYPSLDIHGWNWMISSLHYQDFRVDKEMPCETQDRYPWPYDSLPPTPRVYRPAMYSLVPRAAALPGSAVGGASTTRTAAGTSSSATPSVVSGSHGLQSSFAEQDAARPLAELNLTTPATSHQAASAGHGRQLETVQQDASDSSTIMPDYDWTTEAFDSMGEQFSSAAQREDAVTMLRQAEGKLQEIEEKLQQTEEKLKTSEQRFAALQDYTNTLQAQFEEVCDTNHQLRTRIHHLEQQESMLGQIF